MLLFVLITMHIYPLFSSKASSSDKGVTTCSGVEGSSVFTVQVHCDTAALIKLRTSLTREFSTDYNTMTAALKYFGAIFDNINEDLKDYGVQVRGDFSRLRIENFHLPYDQRKCSGENTVTMRTTIAANMFAMWGERGNKLLVFYCKDIKEGKVNASQTTGKCDNVTGVVIGNLRNLASIIRRELVRSISRDNFEVDDVVQGSFNKNLCSQAKSCISPVKSVYGEFVSGLKTVKHLASEHYMLGRAYRLREHDMYDDVEATGDSGSEPDAYPTQDYSNDVEVYEDEEGKGGLKGKLGGLGKMFGR